MAGREAPGQWRQAIWPPIYNNLGTFAPLPSPTHRPFSLNVYEIYSSLIPKLVTLALVIKKKKKIYKNKKLRPDVEVNKGSRI